MSDNRIFDDTYRETFIKNSDPLTLNNYLKNMQSLSKKGGKYLEMYNKDLMFVLDLNDDFQDGGNMASCLSEKPCDTEVYIDRFNSITQKTVINPKSELDNIKDTLLNNKISYENRKKAVIVFIDSLFNHNPVFMKEYNGEKISNILAISNIISKNIEYMKDGFIYLTKVLQTSRNKISEEFMKEYMELRNKKIIKDISKDYHHIKNKLIKEYSDKVGTEKVYTSKFVEKIINAYKKAKVNGQI